MPENRTSALLQTSSHVLVVGAGLVYLFGFIIVSVFDATYGSADFSLFRTKVIAVGIVFVVLVALGMVLTFRMFSLFGLAVESSLFGLTVTPQNRLVVLVDVALSIPFACLRLAWPLSFLFLGTPLWVGNWYLLIVILSAVLVTLKFISKKYDAHHKHPFVLLLFNALNTSAFFIILLRYAPRNIFWFVVWLSLVCIFTLQISLKVRNFDEARKTEWERLFLTIVPVIFGLYAVKVYPKIEHQFGGGAPVPIVLHLTKKLPAFDSENATVSLIDETEQGYNVLSGSDRAVFVTRGLVEEVEFLRTKEDGTKKQ
jgi:hypothetical protein